MVTRDDWRDTIGFRVPQGQVPVVSAVLQLSPSDSTSGVFRAELDRNPDVSWWVKPPNMRPHSRMLAHEFIVARLGEIVGAPVCQLKVVEVPADLDGETVTASGFQISSGICVATRDVPGAPQFRTLRFRDADSNRTRHVGVYAIWDWLCGDDEQWLYATEEDYRLYSHDHGQFLGGELGIAAYGEAAIGQAWNALNVYGLEDLDRIEARRLAAEIESVSHADLVAILQRVPETWVADNIELESIGWAIERRAPDVSARLRAI